VSDKSARKRCIERSSIRPSAAIHSLQPGPQESGSQTIGVWVDAEGFLSTFEGVAAPLDWAAAGAASAIMIKTKMGSLTKSEGIRLTIL
jgi:hypothetical protein